MISTLTDLDNSALQLRYQKGWLIANEAVSVLQENYSIKKVVLFGSLLDINKFRYHSDIDLAVWGLTEDDYAQAHNSLLALSPEFTIDLVPFESAPINLQNLILQQGIDLSNVSLTSVLTSSKVTKMNKNQNLVLIGYIQQELQELDKLIQANQRLLNKIKATQDQDYVGTIALNLHGFYSGVERIFKQIAQTIDQTVPDTANWHRKLLRQMMASIPHLRPSVISQDTQILLDDYCSFRHVVRNIYTINFKLERVQALAEDLPQCYESLKKDLKNFMTQLS